MTNKNIPDQGQNNAELCLKIKKLSEKSELSILTSGLGTAIGALFLWQDAYTVAIPLLGIGITGAVVNMLVCHRRDKILKIISKR